MIPSLLILDVHLTSTEEKLNCVQVSVNLILKVFSSEYHRSVNRVALVTKSSWQFQAQKYKWWGSFQGILRVLASQWDVLVSNPHSSKEALGGLFQGLEGKSTT